MNSPISTERAISLGTGALQNMRSFVGRGAKISTPVTMICGIIADLASTIAKFSLYLLIVAACAALISGFLWFARYRRHFLQAATDGVMSPEEVRNLGESNGWSVMFAFSVVASVVMGGFVVAEKMGGDGDKGVLASTIPGLEKLQNSLFRVEQKIEGVKNDTQVIRKDTGAIREDAAVIRNDTAAVRQDTTRIAASVEEIAKRFDSLASTGGLIPNPTTPEAHYHNARFQEVSGNFAAARKEYADYLMANLDVLDPWLSYSAMLKVQEGRAGAIEALRFFGEKAKPNTASFETALALLEEPGPRRNKLAALAASHPDYGPLLHLLSQEYSNTKLGEQTMADQRAEKEWLEKFRAANAAGKFLRYFLDKKEAQKWLDDADARWAKLQSTPARVLENPVTLTAMKSNSGWAVTFISSDFKMKELFYKLDGSGEFVSTGHQAFQNPQTGLPQVNTYLPLPNLAPGAHTIEVKYLDKNDQTNGPYTLKFSTADQQLAQGKMMLNAAIGSWLSFRDFDGKVLLYFTTLMSYRPVIREVRYSLNSDALDQTFTFKPSEIMFEPGDDVFLSVPKNTGFANVQVTFKDGAKSAVQKIMREK